VTFYENGTYEGYAVDLIGMLAQEFHFQFIFHEVADGKMGSPNNASIYKHGWDGLVGEILDGASEYFLQLTNQFVTDLVTVYCRKHIWQ